MKITDEIYLCASGAFGLTPSGDCHCYVLNGTSELAMIDCGLQINPDSILKQMESDGLDPKKLRKVLLTHTHPDHANGCKWLKDNLGVEIWASSFEAQALEKGLLHVLGFHCVPQGYEPFDQIPRVKADHIVEDNEWFQVGQLTLQAILTPGHTAGSTCYWMDTPNGRHLFCGDEVFYHGFISVLSPPLSSYEQYLLGLSRLRNCEVDGLFPSHLMWTLKNGQKHIHKALWDLETGQRPNLKPFS